MGRISRVIKLKLGPDTHIIKKNAADKQGTQACQQCSLRSLCFEIGKTERKRLCDAILIEVYDSPSDFSPYGGHFEVSNSHTA